MAVYAEVVKSCSRADSTASAFSQVQEAIRYVRILIFIATVVKVITYWKDGFRRHKSRPGRACSRSQRARRCTGQRRESLGIILESKFLIISRLSIWSGPTYGKSSGDPRSRSQRQPCCRCSGEQTPCHRSTWPEQRRRSQRLGWSYSRWKQEWPL